MRTKLSWGESDKGNVLGLVEALLALAEEELELDDSELKTAVQVKWESACKLRVTGKIKRKTGKREQMVEVGTTKKDLVKLVEKFGKNLEFPKRQRGVGRSKEEREADVVQNVIDYLKALGVLEEDAKNTRKNQGFWQFTLTLESELATREDNLRWIEQKWNEHTQQNPPSQATSNSATEEGINWRDICGKVLAQQREQQRLRRQATERGFELNVYVPLGLVERKQQQRRRGDVPLEEVYQLTEEVITKEYDNDKFLTEVIEPGKSKRIAIIGEPGAGKTTLQEKIAVWLYDNNKGLPICIPLGGLQGKSLEDYLQQIWLKAALRFIEPDASGVDRPVFAALQKQFREGKVWLLLDGVDEMAATSPVEALATIKEQLTDWLVETRVVLTCRLNVWDAKVNNTLTGFETYRTLEFKPEQVEKFIRDWFACANESQRGEELLRKLQETGRERIRQLVRNPLRLSLLCQTSYVLPVDEPLPETKAALYERFTRYFYEWKQEQHPTTRTERRQLNQALGELAKAGIDSTTRFRLGENLACDVMGESLFNLACRLGWLNLVDREAKTDEAVYAFFHPTFQEYFAACAINDWHFFLNHDNENPNLLLHPNPELEYKNGKLAYRIFEPQWKEVILLWLGRPKEEVPDEQKDEFIKNLVEFEDGTGYQFYWYRAFFMAIIGLGEFRNYSETDKILDQCVKWSFGKFDKEIQNWIALPLGKQAKKILKEIAYESVSLHFIKALNKYKDKKIVIEIIIGLTEISFKKEINEEIIEELIALLFSLKLFSEENQSIIYVITRELGEIGIEHQRTIESLLEILHYTNEVESDIKKSCSTKVLYHPLELYRLLHIIRDVRCLVLETLGKITGKNKIAINRLREVLDSMRDQESRIEAASILWKINPGDSMTIKVIREILLNTDNELIFQKAIWTLVNIATGDHRAIDMLLEIYNETQDEETRRIVCNNLGKTGNGNQIAIDGLKEILRTNQNDYTRKEAAESLGTIDPGNTTAIKVLEGLLYTTTTTEQLLLAATSLGKIAPGNPIAIEKLRKLCTSNNEVFRWDAAESLWELNPGDLIAIETLIKIVCIDSVSGGKAAKILMRNINKNPVIVESLIQLLSTELDELSRMRIAKLLGKSNVGKDKAIELIIQIMDAAKDEDTRWNCAKCLGEISPDNLKFIDILIEVLKNTQSSYVREQIIQQLGEIALDNEAAIQELIKILCTSQDNLLHWFAANGLQKIRQHKFMVMTVTSLKKNLEDQFDERDCRLDKKRWEVLFQCAQNMPYPDFYQAWHQTTIHERR